MAKLERLVMVKPVQLVKLGLLAQLVKQVLLVMEQLVKQVLLVILGPPALLGIMVTQAKQALQGSLVLLVLLVK
jgi:hypothetical protein